MSDIIYYIEEKPYRYSQIQSELHKSVIEKLKERGILKRKAAGYCKFSFVGIVSIDIKLIIFLPKYLVYQNDLSNTQKLQEIKQIVKVLKKYSVNNRLEEDVSFLSNDSTTENFSLLALVEFIINDYLEYGLYSNDISETEYNGDGDILWENTVEKELIYPTNKQYIYLNYLTDLTYADNNSYISQLHKMILNTSIEFMKNISYLELFDFPNIQFNINNHSLGQESFQLKQITNEMTISFSQRKIKLLKAMKNFINNELISLDSRTDFFYGTASFNMVWEKVCSDVIQNEKHLFINNIPKPNWHQKAPTLTKPASKTLTPDIIKTFEDNFFILDAKYYKPIFNENKLIPGHPGVEDVSKQYLYELAFKNIQSTKYNLFIYPIYNELNKIDGKVTFELFEGLELTDIYLLQLNPNELFEKYLANEHLEHTFFQSIKREILTY